MMPHDSVGLTPGHYLTRKQMLGQNWQEMFELKFNIIYCNSHTLFILLLVYLHAVVILIVVSDILNGWHCIDRYYREIF